MEAPRLAMVALSVLGMVRLAIVPSPHGVPTWRGVRGVVAAHKSSSRLDEGRSDRGVDEVAECNSETTPP